VAALGYIPSFCTACYRLGRTGRDFMDLAKPGEIKEHCDPNALATFVEYLEDYASAETRTMGDACVRQILETMEPGMQQMSAGMVERVRAGKRDVYC
jgi:2-iminoacetate synthase